jgi:hypothetical protein
MNDLQRLIIEIPAFLREWSPRFLSSNPNIDESFLKSLGHDVYVSLFNLYQYSRNPQLKWEEIMALPLRGWDIGGLLALPCVTLERLKTSIGIETVSDEVARDLSSNPNITMNFVIEHPGIRWCTRRLSFNHAISWKDTRRRPDWDWCTGAFDMKSGYDDLATMHKDTGHSISLFTACIHNPWLRWRHVNDASLRHIFKGELHEYVTLPILAKIIDVPFCVIEREIFTWTRSVIELLDHAWMSGVKWRRLCALRPDLSTLMARDPKKAGYHWSRWPHLTAEFVVAHPEIMWCPNTLSCHPFKYGIRLRMWAALTIQNAWIGWQCRRLYKKRKGWAELHAELLYCPGLGVLYKESKESFMNALEQSNNNHSLP